MTLIGRPMRSNSWVGAIRNPSLALGGMMTFEESDGSKSYFIPSIFQDGDSEDAYPADYRRIEV